VIEWMVGGFEGETWGGMEGVGMLDEQLGLNENRRGK
jgi:hypothetical protein